MALCDATMAPNILKIFVHKFQGLYFTLTPKLQKDQGYPFPVQNAQILIGLGTNATGQIQEI
jgi:hypothetical protein